MKYFNKEQVSLSFSIVHVWRFAVKSEESNDWSKITCFDIISQTWIYVFYNILQIIENLTSKLDVSIRGFEVT